MQTWMRRIASNALHVNFLKINMLKIYWGNNIISSINEYLIIEQYKSLMKQKDDN